MSKKLIGILLLIVFIGVLSGVFVETGQKVERETLLAQ